MTIARALPLATLTAALLLGGCMPYSEGGAGLSNDVHTYVSTPAEPKTVTVEDWRTHDVLLTVEIPVGQQLVIKFNKDYYVTDTANPPANPDQMRWDLMEAGRSYRELPNEMPVPGAPNGGRIVTWHLREPGEFPDAARRGKATAAR